MRTTFDEIVPAFSTSWLTLDTWLAENERVLHVYGAADSSLPGWSRIELVAHLARAFDALVICEPAPEGTVPLSLAEYLGTYPSRAAQILEVTQNLAATHQDNLLQVVRTSATNALENLNRLIAAAADSGLGDPGDLVVQARRGPILLRDMVVSRLIEVVVHTYDLVNSFNGLIDSRGDARPLDRDAERIVANELLRIVITRGGWQLTVADPSLWIALATGRQPYDVDALARALEPVFTSDSVPDLGRMLPLL